MPKQIALNSNQVRTLALKLEAEFGSSDRERLQRLIELIGNDGTLPYHQALQIIAPGKPAAAAQTDLRAFRSRLAMACNDAKLGNLCLEVDSKKKSKSEERRLWFTGDDLAQEHLTAFARELVQEHYSNYQSRDYVEQSVAVSVDKPATDKPKPIVFISYVHEDSRDKTLLLERIDELRNSLSIDITVWSDAEIIPGQSIGIQIEQQLQQVLIPV